MEIVETRFGLVQESKTSHEIKIGPKSKNRGAGNHDKKRKKKVRGKKQISSYLLSSSKEAKRTVLNSHVLLNNFKTMQIFETPNVPIY